MGKGFRWINIIVIAGILAIFTGICFYLDWAWYIYGRDYVLVLASLVVATVAAIAALISLGLTRKSLYLTRVTQRPFLNVESISPVPSRTNVNHFFI
jgi:hypothetical protein